MSKVNNVHYLRVSDAINKLSEEARPPGCKKLTGIDAYRIRVGNFRVLYEIDDENNSVTIYKISSRDKAYQN